MKRLRQGLYMVEAGGWVNAYLIEGPRGLTLVDTGHPRCAEEFVQEIVEAGFAIRDIEQILLTHHHFDHAGGLPVLLAKNRIKVYAHPDDHAMLTGKAPKPSFGSSPWLLRLLQKLWFPYRPLEVVVPLKQNDGLRALPHWQVLHTPGHTLGSLSLYQPSDYTLICGDALNNRGNKLGLPPAFNEDKALLVQSVKKLAELPCEMLCVGHGPVIRSGAGQRIHVFAESLKKKGA